VSHWHPRHSLLKRRCNRADAHSFPHAFASARAPPHRAPRPGRLAGGKRIVGDDPRVDVLTVAWKVTFDAAYPRRVVRRIQGTRVPFLALPDLVASKQTRRAADLADIEVLSRK